MRGRSESFGLGTSLVGTRSGFGGRDGEEGRLEMEPTGRLFSRRQREKAKCEMWDFERGSAVERTRAPRSAREGAAETRPW